MTDYTLYFIAIVLPEPALSEIRAFKRRFEEKYDAKTAMRSDPHITLIAPFRWSFNKEHLLLNALEGFKSSVQPFDVQLNGFDAFYPRVLFVKPLQNPHFLPLKKELQLHVQKQVGKLHKTMQNRFHPHVTLVNRDLTEEQFAEAWAEWRYRKYAAAFTADRFSLLKNDGKKWNTCRDFML